MKIDYIYYRYTSGGTNHWFTTINYHSPREIYKYEPYGGTVLRSFIDTNLVQVNGYRLAHSNYCFMEFKNLFVDGVTEIWYEARDIPDVGWMVPSNQYWGYDETTVGHLHSTVGKKEIPITMCYSVGAISKELNNKYRIPTIIETELVNKKNERNKLLNL